MPTRRKAVSKPLTLGDLPSKLAAIKTSQLLYILLLLSVFVIGYLVARVQDLSKNPTTAQGTNNGGGQQAQPAKTLTNDDIKRIAKDIGLNEGEFNSCLDNNTHTAKVDEDTTAGTTAGTSGTPTFYINGTQLVGAQPYESFKTAIDAAINGTTGSTSVEVGHLPPLGRDSATVNVIEFSDLECPFCRSYFNETFPKIKKDYIDTGKIKYYFRHYPLSFHPMAKPFANAVECANDQDKFWEMHDRIFEEQS